MTAASLRCLQLGTVLDQGWWPLGVPFVALAGSYARAGSTFAWLRRHGRTIERVGGAILIVMGLLTITGQWDRLFTPLIRLFSRHRWPPI